MLAFESELDQINAGELPWYFLWLADQLTRRPM
jgi:hypothetical protein